jgi:hypothetical protein
MALLDSSLEIASLADGVASSVEAIIGLTLVGLGVMAVFGVLRFVGSRILGLPPASRYWWFPCVVLVVGALAAAVGLKDVGLVAAVIFAFCGVWWVATDGVGDDELRDVMEHHQDDFGDAA